MIRENPSHLRDPVAESLPELRDFSLVLGGPLYQLLCRAHLEDDAGSHLRRRIAVVCGFIWLPLLVLCAVEGTLLQGVKIPFLFDVETHARFLVAAPLMILAELIVHRRIRDVIAQFVERRLIPAGSMDLFREAIRSAVRWRNSIFAELALLAIVLPLGYYIRTDVFALKASTWYATAGVDGTTLTLPGFWFTWVSNPLLQFLLLRWCFRVVIWTRFLWQISRIQLDLIPTHPDRNAGLGFLGGSAYAYSPLLASISAMVAGLVASRIFYQGASLADFKLEIVILVGLGMLLVFGPLTVFAGQILAAKRLGLREYGVFAAEYSREFDRRWLRSAGHDDVPLLGAGDIQSLADLANAFSIIKEIRPVPFGRDTFVQLVWATLLPFFPLVFTMIPLDELLDRLVGAVF